MLYKAVLDNLLLEEGNNSYMSINKEKFIYDDLKQYFKKNENQLYAYQDLESAGKNEY